MGRCRRGGASDKNLHRMMLGSDKMHSFPPIASIDTASATIVDRS
jgi:hypothetical protein